MSLGVWQHLRGFTQHKHVVRKVMGQNKLKLHCGACLGVES